MKIRKGWIAGAAIAAALALSGAALAAAAGSTSNDPSAGRPAAAPGVPDAIAPNARAAALVDGTSLLYAKNVLNVTRPSTGTYCVKVRKDKIEKLGKVVPSITIEWGNSSGSDLAAFWYRGAPDCPDHNVEVLTYDFAENRTDNVAFVVAIL